MDIKKHTAQNIVITGKESRRIVKLTDMSENTMNCMEQLLSMTEAIVPFETDTDEYKTLTYTEIHHVTLKAALIDDMWIPISQLRCDEKANLYVKDWFYQKEIAQQSMF